MNKLDPHTLFSIFEQEDEEIYKEHGLESNLKNPFVLIGMVIRGIENYQMMDMMYMKQYPQEYKNVRAITRYKYYNRLYSYLTRIKSDRLDSKFTIGDSFDLDSVKNALDHLRVYYEKLEEYEKCAVIKKFLDFTYLQNRKVLI